MSMKTPLSLGNYWGRSPILFTKSIGLRPHVVAFNTFNTEVFITKLIIGCLDKWMIGRCSENLKI